MPDLLVRFHTGSIPGAQCRKVTLFYRWGG